MAGKRLVDVESRAEVLEVEVALLKGLVLRLAVAAVDPEEFEDANEYVAEVFGFCEVNSDAGPATEAEIDELVSIMVEEYAFGDDEDDDEEDVVEVSDG